MQVEPDFKEMVVGAYRRLYDIAQLRVHPLASYLLETDTLSTKEQGWQLHRLLIDAIDELALHGHTPVNSPEWRRQRVMTLRYIDALSPNQVADKLAISRRQYYREHRIAMQVITETLWNNRLTQDVPELPKHVELLQSEVTRLTNSDSKTNSREVLGGVIVLFEQLLTERSIEIKQDIPADMPLIKVSYDVLRQIIVGLLGYWIQRIDHSTIHIMGDTKHGQFTLKIVFEPVTEIIEDELEQWLATNDHLLKISSGTINIVTSCDDVCGFELALPIDAQHSILVVDDNVDMLELYKRYLNPNGYHVLSATSVSDALSVLHQTKPHAIILDLMMPEQDGWDLLQIILKERSTAQIPIMVCSVLRQQELALALGATAFLEKPITESSLLVALNEFETIKGVT